MRFLKVAIATMTLVFSWAANASVDILNPDDGEFVDADRYTVVAKCRDVEVLGQYFRVEVLINDELMAAVDTDGITSQVKEFNLHGNLEFALEKVFNGERTGFTVVGVKSFSSSGTHIIAVNLIDAKDYVFDSDSITVYVK